MDLNLKIIEAVKQKPCLYGSSSKLEDRAIGWSELSEELQMKEQDLKIRWHSLVHRYRTDDFFKYANRMNFVERNVQIKVKSDKWPEFEITENDIAKRRTNNADEYVFLEVDDLETPNVQNPTDSLEGFSVKCESSEKSVKNNKDLEMDDTPEKSISEPTNGDKESDTVPTKAANVNIGTKKIASDRCEDVIFGELVTAMLQRMEEERKRNIKKEIMNILLT